MMLCLLALLAADDGEAAVLLRDFRESLLKARTLDVETSVRMETAGQAGWSFSGILKVRDKACWVVDLAFEASELMTPPRKSAASLFCDGRRVTALETPAGLKLAALKPEEVASEIRAALGTASTPFFLILRPLDDQRKGRLDKPAAVEAVRDGGEQVFGERVARVVEYTARVDLGWEFVYRAKLFLDPATRRPLGRELVFETMKVTETFARFEVDADLPDSDFAFQSPRRLARAQARRLAASVELFGLFTGRHPAALGDLLERPAAVDKEAFWPEGGFFPAPTLPRDPWGRDFVLRAERGWVSVVSLGSDGKAGGRGDAEDAAFRVPAVSRRCVGAPSRRLEQQFTAQVRIRLLAATVEAWRDAYGEYPGRRSALWERPSTAEVWPEGGWLPGGLPKDPWGEELRLIGDPGQVRVQVRDPRKRLLSEEDLTGEERRGLENADEPRLRDEDRKKIDALFEQLGADAPEAREAAQDELRSWGSALASKLEERQAKEEDAEVRTRVQQLYREFGGEGVPAWSRLLQPLESVLRATGVER